MLSNPAILYQDDALIAVNKPVGTTVIPARNEQPERSLWRSLEAARNERLWVVHRLDRDTSGVVVFARHASAHRALSLAFERRAVQKVYLAFTRGVPVPEQGTITVALHTARRGKMRPAREGESGALPSQTVYGVSLVAPTEHGMVARVELRPRTGRQHQIRVHLRAIGTALLVDPLYGGMSELSQGSLGLESPGVARLTLHAMRLEIPHPSDHRSVTIDAPLPDDLAALNAWLERVAHAGVAPGAAQS